MTQFALPAGLTAEAAFLAVADRPYPAFLDSAGGPAALSGQSFVASDPFLVLQGKGRKGELSFPRGGRTQEWHGDPFAMLRRLLADYRSPHRESPALAFGGAIGYLSYDLHRHIEPLRPGVVDDLGMPDLFLAFYDVVARFDHRQGTAHVSSTDWGGPRRARRDVWELWRSMASGPHAGGQPPMPAAKGTIESSFSREEFCAAVERAKRYIRAGEIYQANLSQRFCVPYVGNPLDFYRRLRRVDAAPFAACLFPDDFAVLSHSPERYLRVDGEAVDTRPIKGTRPRGATPAEDRRQIEELRRSAKDRAEHVMIVDLERNDLGRVCAFGSVRVPEFLSIESYANVHHLVSTVRGRLRPSMDVVDCIVGSFPGGSITGAPKVRAIQVIEELERTSRGVYCGAIGYLDFCGRAELSIAIRTAVHHGGRLYFQVGGGIVADSEPQAEYEETLHKARSFFETLGVGVPAAVAGAPAGAKDPKKGRFSGIHQLEVG